MASLAQLASVSDVKFGMRYRWMIYLFLLAPVAFGIFHLIRERERILGDYGQFLYGLIPCVIFFIGYSWYLRAHGIYQQVSSATDPDAKSSEDSIAK